MSVDKENENIIPSFHERWMILLRHYPHLLLSIRFWFGVISRRNPVLWKNVMEYERSHALCKGSNHSKDCCLREIKKTQQFSKQMQFSKRGDFYRVSWISGLEHNFLAIVFVDGDDVPEPQIQMLPVIGECRNTALKESEIFNSVIKGVAEANRVFDTTFRVSRIEYVANDTPPENRYAMLAYHIVGRLVAGGEFPS